MDERGRFCGGKKERRWEMMESFGGVKAGARLKWGEMGTMQHKCMREDEIWHYKFLL